MLTFLQDTCYISLRDTPRHSSTTNILLRLRLLAEALQVVLFLERSRHLQIQTAQKRCYNRTERAPQKVRRSCGSSWNRPKWITPLTGDANELCFPFPRKRRLADTMVAYNSNGDKSSRLRHNTARHDVITRRASSATHSSQIFLIAKYKERRLATVVNIHACPCLRASPSGRRFLTNFATTIQSS